MVPFLLVKSAVDIEVWFSYFNWLLFGTHNFISIGKLAEKKYNGLALFLEDCHRTPEWSNHTQIYLNLKMALFQSPPPLLNYKKRCSKIVHTAIFMLEMLWKFVQLFTLTRFNAVYNIENYFKKTFM